ncbi:uncharacterized protein isoform X1 [Choristoneura fumiferana]|uniref:uncharacterized protein isoform X1 n=2 Tax=Choristoneura fumiferana TaxID=7141 RepID=UPI003D15B02F
MIMTGICRLCLSYSTQNMISLSECEASITIVLSIQISPIELLPNQVCTMCSDKLKGLKEFQTQVHRNEQILKNHLNQGSECLNIFYKTIKNSIKEETRKSITTDVTDNKLVEKNELDMKQLKVEEDLNLEQGIDYDSEDELPLVDIKKENNDDSSKPGIEMVINDFKFKCLTCFDKLQNQVDLVNHYNNVHKTKVKNKHSYTLVKDDDKVLYKCVACGVTYDCRKKITRHSQIYNEERFHCKICGRTYKTVSEIIRHGRAHDGPKVACSFGCGFASVYSGALKTHEDRHRQEYKYKCETCNKSFQVKTWYEQHQNIHKGLKPFVCQICGLAFHMDRYLTSHRSSVHPNASPLNRYVCVHCSKPCGTMKALTLHLKEHGITSSLLCDLCGKSVSTTEQLKKHRLTHSGIKPFACKSCDKTFSKKFNLKLHQITHTGERAHACESCGKQYTQRSALIRHVNRHHKPQQK